MMLSYIKQQLQQVSKQFTEIEDESLLHEYENSLLDEIEKYSIYKIETIQQYVAKSKIIHKKIMSLRKSLHKNILIKSRNSEKNPSCIDIIIIQYNINRNLKELNYYLIDYIPNTKNMEQDKIFKKILSEITTPYELKTNIASLAEIRKIMKDKNIPITRDFETVLSYFYKYLHPISKDMFVKKLVKTKKFTEHDAIEILHTSSINIKDNKIYPTFDWMFRL